MKYLKLIIFFTSLQLMAHASSAEKISKDVVKAHSPFDIMTFALPKSEPALYANYRKKWTRLTGFEFSGLHWQQFVSIYVNKGADIYRENYLAYLSRYRDDEDEDEDEDEENTIDMFKKYEVGTIFVKENYLADKGKPGAPSSLTIMKKRESGYDEAGGNWEYLQTDINGNMIMQGNSTAAHIKSACSECHSNMAERDYIFSTFLTSSAKH